MIISIFDPLYLVLKRRPQDFESIIIEPIEEYYRERRDIYKNNPQIRNLRYAIHKSLKEAVLYGVYPAIFYKLPKSAKRLVSFNKTKIEDQASNNLR